MTEHDTLDILLPFYGDVTLMKEAVLSVLGQTDPDWRLVIVDDHQPDLAVPDWVAALQDARIEYHRNDVNLGANANYEKALGLATADLIVFLGADDRLLPRYVERARECFGKGGERATLYQPGVRVIDGDGVPVRPLGDRVKGWLRPSRQGLWAYAGKELAPGLMAGNWTYFPSLCWRRPDVAAVGFRPEFDVVQDLALILDLATRGCVVMVDSEVTFEYRRHAGSDSAIKTVTADRFVEEAALFELFEERFRDLGWSAAERAARRHLTSRLNALTMVPVALRHGGRDAARAIADHALRRGKARR